MQIYIIQDIKEKPYNIYTDLNDAKDRLKFIYLNTPDFKYDEYKIRVYNLINNEFIHNHDIFYNKTI